MRWLWFLLLHIQKKKRYPVPMKKMMIKLFVQINEWLQQKVNIVVILYNVHICCVIGHCIPIQCCSFSVILRLILLRVFIMGEKQNGQEWNLSIFNFQPLNFSLTLFSFSNCHLKKVHYYHSHSTTKVPKNLNNEKRKVPNWLIKKVPVVQLLWWSMPSLLKFLLLFQKHFWL